MKSFYISSNALNHIIALFSFPQELCLKSIREDLQHYYKFLSAQPDPDNLIQTTVLSSLRELMQVVYCSIYTYFLFFLNSWICKNNYLFSSAMLHIRLWWGGREGKRCFIVTCANSKYIQKNRVYKLNPPPLILKVSVNHQSNYAKRLKLCKVLRGFHVRSITINRAVNYMNSGEDAQWAIETTPIFNIVVKQSL